MDRICNVFNVPKPILFFMMISEDDIPEDKKEIYKDFEPLLKEFVSEIFD